MFKVKNLLIIQTIIIIALVFFLWSNKSPEPPSYNGFLSPRVYAGILEPKSYLITNFQPLKNELADEVADSHTSVYVENLRDGANFDINGEQKFYPLSLNKVPLGILIMQKVEEGKLNLDTLIPINDNNRDQYFGDLYNNSAKKLPLKVLMEKMLSESDNTAFFTLLAYLDNRDLKFLLDYYPIDFSVYYNSIQLNNSQTKYLISVKDYSNVFRSLYLSTLLNAKNSEYILGLLKDNAFDVKKTANLPDDVTVAHKFGSNYADVKAMHDCGIMYISGGSKILYCVMTNGLKEQEATAKIGNAINKIYNYISTAKAELDRYKNQKS